MPDVATADRLYAAVHDNKQLPPLSDTLPGLTLDDGYRIAAAVHSQRVANGQTPVGRKIGFTNRTIWPIYNVDAPVWGWMYEHSVKDIPENGLLSLPALPELRIEPEIVFGFKATPTPDMDLTDVADCVDWVAHGIEIVMSLYPGWRFTAPDSVAACAMHAALWVGERMKPTAERMNTLATCEITMTGPEGTQTGSGADVLGGPITALHHLISQIDRMPGAGLIQPGEVVTTGTLTDARPIAAGETWRTEFGTPLLRGLTVTFI